MNPSSNRRRSSSSLKCDRKDRVRPLCDLSVREECISRCCHADENAEAATTVQVSAMAAFLLRLECSSLILEKPVKVHNDILNYSYYPFEIDHFHFSLDEINILM